MREVVRQAISTLNERQRMAVLLSKFESMSYEDIAETMEMTPQAIKSLLSRARTNLRQVLEPYLQTGEMKKEQNGRSESDEYRSPIDETSPNDE